MTQVVPKKDKLLIIGNGMAAGRLLDEILKRNPTQFDITIIGDEPEGSYNRIMLSPVLAGEIEQHTIVQKDSHWYAQNGITFIAGGRVSALHPENKTAELTTGEQFTYDELVIATGSQPSRIPAKNQHLANIFAFRTLQDVGTIENACKTARNAVVVGGGLLGLEAAYGLAQKGIHVTLVHRSPWLLNRQLDKTAGELLRNVMENMNIAFCLSDEIDSFHASTSEHTLTSATLKSGKTLACDLAIIATGISPNKQLAETCNLNNQRAIVVNELMQTSHNNISALGECCEFNGHTFGLVEPIWHQCRTLASRLTGEPPIPFAITPVATKLKVSGVQLYSAGEVLTKEEHHEIVMQDPASNIYRKLILNNNRIVGIVLFGDTRDGNIYFDLMQAQTDVSQQLPHLIFGQHYCNATMAENQKQIHAA